MGSASHDESSQKAIEAELVETGETLLASPSSTDELLPLVEKTESLLAKIWQRPPVSTCFALLPAMKALITDDILHHTSLEVQVVVASCFNELTRITCPDHSYDDDVMMEIFRLFMIAFGQLSGGPGQNYSRAVHIIETMAKVRSFLILLDINTDGHYVVEMFQHFLANIRSNQLSDAFKYMEMIMTSVIQESDNISSELLKPLLSSVKMKNKNYSPISWELGKKVFENCAIKLPSYLRDTVREMNLNLADYAIIVTSICHLISDESPNGKNMVSSKVSQTIDGHESHSDELSEHDDEFLDAETNDGNGTKSNAENSLRAPKADLGSLRRRERKPNSIIRPEEGYDHFCPRGDKYYNKLSSDDYDDKDDSDLMLSRKGNASIFSNSSKTIKDFSLHEGSLSERPQIEKERASQPNNAKFPSTVGKKSLQSKENDKKAIGASSNIKVKTPQNAHKNNSKRLRAPCKEKLVNKRIKVWWPMDETFYSGIVTSFDPETRRHTILYDDDEIEILELRNEMWALCSNEQPPRPPQSQREEADLPSAPQHSVKVLKKANTKRNAGPLSKPQHAASLTKRLKSENHSAIDHSENRKTNSALTSDELNNDTNIVPNCGRDRRQEPETFSRT